MANFDSPYIPYPVTSPDDVLPPIKYSLPQFEWGSLHISEGFYDAYGLVPLTEASQNGFIPHDGPTMRPSTRLFFMSAAELDTPEATDEEVFLRHSISKKGLEFVIALGGNKTAVADKMASMAREQTDDPWTRDNIPLDEQIMQIVPQAALHGLVNVIEGKLPDLFAHWQRVENSRLFHRQIRGIGALTTLAAGTTATLAALSGNINPYSAEIIGLWAGVGAILVDHQLESLTHNANSREQLLQIGALVYARQISDDVHDAFCRHVFDRQVLLNLPPDEV